MGKKEKLRKEGTVLEIYKNAVFKVKLDEDQREILAHLAG